MAKQEWFEGVPSDVSALVRYRSARGEATFGVVRDGSVFEAKTPLSFATDVGERVGSIEDVELLAPTEPQTIVCAGQNCRTYYEQNGLDLPSEPGFFIKPPVSMLGPGADVVWPEWATRSVYPAAEIALVIGSKTRDVSVEEAASHILGVTSGNELQLDMEEWTIHGLFPSKCFEGSTTIGPAIVPLKEPFGFSCSVDGTTIQSSSSEALVFGFAELVAHASKVLTLYPGDILLCGSAPPVDAVKHAREVGDLTRRGSLMQVRVEGAGVVENALV